MNQRLHDALRDFLAGVPDDTEAWLFAEPRVRTRTGYDETADTIDAISFTVRAGIPDASTLIALYEAASVDGGWRVARDDE